MNFNWRIIILLGVLIAAIVLIFIGFKKNVDNLSNQKEQIVIATPAVEEKMPVATGNIDDVASFLLLDVNGEISKITSDSTDVSAMNYDDVEISNFGQSYEDEF